MSFAHIIHRIATDPTFRAQIRVDLEATIKACGVQLTNEEWSALREVQEVCSRHPDSPQALNPVDAAWMGGPSITPAVLRSIG